MAYPALRTTKEDDNVASQLSSASTLHISSSVHAKALEREFFLLRSVRSVQNVFLCYESRSRRKREKETLNVFLLLEKTRIRNVRCMSKHFPTTKVNFLTIKVIRRITRTITVSRNATDDFRTESERLA